MKALLCKEFGPPESLVLEDIPAPSCGLSEVRIGVHAAGVNFPDTLIIQGKYQFQPPFPFAPGGEVAGEVLEVGSEVTHVSVGDRVFAMVGWNGFAEEAVAPGPACIKMPEGMDFETAANFALAYGTTYYALVQRGRLQAGETLLVHGATGGVGTAAIEVGQCLGARIVATGGSADKLKAIQERYSLEHVINYREADSLKDAVKAVTGGVGADVIYDPIGGHVFEQSLRCINWDGRLLVVGFASGDIPAAKANVILLKSCSVVGVFWGAFAAREPEQNRQNLETLLQWYGEGKIRPWITQRYPLAEGGRAIQALMDRTVVGKAVVQVRTP